MGQGIHEVAEGLTLARQVLNTLLCQLSQTLLGLAIGVDDADDVFRLEGNV